MEIAQEQQMMTVAQLAQYLRVSQSWIYHRYRSRLHPLPVHRVGRALRFRREDVDRWLKENTKGADPNEY